MKRLLGHTSYSARNPNRARALIGSFALMNPSQFHRPDGKGYAFVADMLLEFDAFNPQLAGASRPVFRTWRMMSADRRTQALSHLQRLSKRGGLSSDLSDIIERTIGAG